MVDISGMGPMGAGTPQQGMPPSLLQMAQGMGPGWQSDPGLNAGAPFRQITSPEDQNWSDLSGNPIHMGGPPPEYNPGTTQGGYNAVFDPRAASSTGGWFSMDDYLNQAPSPMEAAMNPGSRQSPQRHKGGNALSTNNWRLLGDDPDKFMINGNVVNRRTAQSELAPRSVLGQEGGTMHPGYNFMGGGQWMRPYGSQGSMQGYIGSDNWATTGTPTY